MNREGSNFNVGYGIASVAITATGVTIVATTEANYHGVSMLAATTGVTVKVYNTAAGTGNLVDVIYAVANGTGWSDKYIPIVCRKGITVSVTGTGGSGIIFYGPKG
jgi:hypothetical protein